MFEPVSATIARETSANEPIKLIVKSGTGPILTRLCTYDWTVFGGLKIVPGAAKDVTEWPAGLVPAGTWVGVVVWNEAKESDGPFFYDQRNGFKWNDEKGCQTQWVGCWQTNSIYTFVA
jgi:hypothetical protein